MTHEEIQTIIRILSSIDRTLIAIGVLLTIIIGTLWGRKEE